MRGRLTTFVAVVFLHSACGGSDFDDNASTGGAAGSGGSAGSGGTVVSGGTGGAAGADSSVGATGGSSGSAGSGGSSGSAGSGGSSGAAGSGGGSAGAPSGGGTSADSGTDSSVDGAAGSGGDADADSGSGPPIAIVQITPTALSTDNVPTLTLQATPAAGNSIIVGITCISDHLGDCIVGPSGVTDNQGNSYTRALQGESIKSSSQGARGYIFIAQNIGATSGSFVISVDPDGTTAGQSLAWGAIEVSGLAAPPSLDASDIGLVGATGSTTVTSDTATTQANELAVGVLSVRSTDTNILITPESTWASHHIHQNNASGPPGHSMISKVLNATGTVSHTWTHHVPTRGAAGILATFKGVTPN